MSQNLQNKIHNLQIRVEQFNDQTEKGKKYQSFGISLSINGHTKSAQTQILPQFRHLPQ